MMSEISRKKRPSGVTLIALLVVVILLVPLLILALSCGKSEQGDIEIGAILPLTGDAAQYGTWAKQGIQLAVNKVKKDNAIEGRKLNVIFEDSKSSQTEGVSALHSLISRYDIQVVLIEYSGLVLAAAPIANEKKVVLMNIGALNPDIRKAGDYVFSNINDANVEAHKIAELAYNNLGVRKLATLYATAAYGVGNRNAMINRFVGLGGVIVDEEEFEPNSSDFKSQLSKINKANPDAIFLSAVTKDASIILRQAHELGMNYRWLSTAFIEGKDLLKLSQNALEGLIYTTTVLDTASGDEHVREFISAYRATYDMDPEIYSATAYDGVMIIYKAIRRVGYDGERIRDYLYTINNYPGVSGLTTFDSNGCVEKPVLFKTVKGGRFVRFQ